MTTLAPTGSLSELFAASEESHAARGAARLWRALGLSDAVRPEAASTIQGYINTRLHELDRGAWPGLSPADGAVAHVVVDGFLVCSQQLATGRAGHVVGPGDVLRPLEVPAAGGVSESLSEWVAVTPVTLATVDRRFTCAAVKFPVLLDRVFEAMELRTRRVAELHAISGIRKVDERVMTLMWQLAEAWGSVTRDGVAVPIPLTHALLAKLVSAQRPSVSTAVSHLASAGALTRRGERWLLDPASAPLQQAAGATG